MDNEAKLNYRKKSSRIKDDYDNSMDKKLSVLKKINIIEKSKRDEFRSNQLTEESMKKAYIMNRSKINITMYSYIFICITGNILFYKQSVKFVRQIFNLKGFWPIHFGTFIPITLINFSMIGITESFCQNILIENKLDNILENDF